MIYTGRFFEGETFSAAFANSDASVGLMYGSVVALVSFLFCLWALITALCGKAVAGWASSLSAVALLGGIQLISLGVIGEYVGKIFLETKRRPRYIVSERTGGAPGAEEDRSAEGGREP